MSCDVSFYYSVCGVQIQSDTELTELYRTDFGTAEVVLATGDVNPAFEKDPVSVRPFTRFNAQEYFFEFPDVVRILVRNGAEIHLEILTADVRFALQFVYRNALPVVLLQRGIVLFRASGVIDSNGKAWLFLATPRSGMTAAAVFLMERGYRLFSDQLVAIRMDNTVVLASPFGPSIHLWKPVLDKQTMFPATLVRPLRESIGKYSVVVNSDQFDSSDRQVRGLIDIGQLSTTIDHNPIKMIEAYETLHHSVYFNHMTAGMGLESRIFGILTALVRHSTLIRVYRPGSGDSYHQLAEYIDLEVIRGEQFNA